MFARMLVVAGLMTVAGVVVADDAKKPAKFDATKLVGDWKITGGKKMGTELGDEAKKGVYVISKDKITLKEGDKEMFVFGYTLDEKTMPVSIDMVISKSAIDGLEGAKAKGIIELTGDELKLSYETGDDRPTTFTGEKAFNFVLKHSKAK